MNDEKYLSYLTNLENYSLCIKPHLEKLRDRMHFNKVYLEADLTKYCTKERELVIESKDKLKQ